jgi:hypothetical protein
MTDQHVNPSKVEVQWKHEQNAPGEPKPGALAIHSELWLVGYQEGGDQVQPASFWGMIKRDIIRDV